MTQLHKIILLFLFKQIASAVQNCFTLRSFFIIIVTIINAIFVVVGKLCRAFPCTNYFPQRSAVRIEDGAAIFVVVFATVIMLFPYFDFDLSDKGEFVCILMQKLHLV